MIIKKRRLYQGLFLVLSLLVLSCQKMFTEDEILASHNIDDPMLLQSVKAYYQKELKVQMLASLNEKYSKSSQKKSKASKSDKVPRPRMYVLWKKGYTTAFGQEKNVEVPIHASHRTVSLFNISRDSLGYTADRRMLQTVFDRLIISESKGEKQFESQIVRYHPDQKYLVEHKYDMSGVHLYGLGEYTGYLEYITTSGERISVVRVVAGKPIRRYFIGADVLSQKQKLMSKNDNATLSSGYYDCWEECYDEYGMICIGMPGDPDDPGSEMCFEEWIGQTCQEYCTWVDDGGWDSGDFCDNPGNWGTPECDGDEDTGSPGNDQDGGIKLGELSNDDKNSLSNTIQTAKTNCVFRALIDWLESNGNITIKISSTETNMAIYKPNTKEIFYHSSAFLGYTQFLTHEGFHAYQHQNVYGSAFENYSQNMPGNINIEFEQIVFDDIAKRVKEGTTGIGGMFKQTDKVGFDVAKNNYVAWINSLTNNGQSYPNLGNVTNFDADFSQHLNAFKDFGDAAYAGTDIDSNLKPLALKSLFKGNIGTNCNN